MTTLRLKIDPKRHKRENNNQPQDFLKKISLCKTKESINLLLFAASPVFRQFSFELNTETKDDVISSHSAPRPLYPSKVISYETCEVDLAI